MSSTTVIDVNFVCILSAAKKKIKKNITKDKILRLSTVTSVIAIHYINTVII